MPSFLKYWQGKSKQFSAKLVSATAPRKYSCFTNLILLNLVANLTKLLSSTLTRWTSSSFSYQRQRQCSKVCSVLVFHVKFGCVLFFIIHDLPLTIQSQRHLSHQRQPQHWDSMLSTDLGFPCGKRITDHDSISEREAVGFSQGLQLNDTSWN